MQNGCSPALSRPVRFVRGRSPVLVIRARCGIAPAHGDVLHCVVDPGGLDRTCACVVVVVVLSRAGMRGIGVRLGRVRWCVVRACVGREGCGEERGRGRISGSVGGIGRGGDMN